MGYGDLMVIPYPNPDDPRLAKVHKKGFVKMVKEMSVEELEEWLKLFPAWYYRGLRQLIVLHNPEERKVRVVVPKRRSHRSDYYAWVRYLPLPEGGYWYFLTLTLFRFWGMEKAWSEINHWVSKALNRFKTYLRTKYGVDVSYLWVVEVHKDGFPHVHVIFRMPYIHELNFRRLLELFQSYWVDDEGNPLCAPNGVDLKYVGRNVQEVRDYLLEYLVKDHSQIWGVNLLGDGQVAFRRSTALIWVFKVRLFGMSQDVRKGASDRRREKTAEGKKWIFYGSVSSVRLYRLVYEPLGIPWEYWVSNLPKVCWMEYQEEYLPILVPSAFPTGGSCDVWDEVVESF